MKYRFERTKFLEPHPFPVGDYMDKLSGELGNQDKKGDCRKLDTNNVIHFCAWADQKRLGIISVISQNKQCLCFYRANYEFFRLYQLDTLLKQFESFMQKDKNLEINKVTFIYHETGQLNTEISTSRFPLISFDNLVK